MYLTKSKNITTISIVKIVFLPEKSLAQAAENVHRGEAIKCGKTEILSEGDVNMVFEKIRDILCEQLEQNADAVTMESLVVEDLGADSLDVVDIVMSIEDEFEIEVPDEVIENVKTVGDIVKFVEENI